ncbi:hypothetical protein KQX54_007518 [Cotesia glomerata]|uniref:Uncharacterized protein n=1 Tax=Cotesia glomerata TaxID=32391 RepID=A0AAV7IND7_COTGL|nr:hypothetical protein KQX54_007518 [Cotesia glomerata]
MMKKDHCDMLLISDRIRDLNLAVELLPSRYNEDDDDEKNLMKGSSTLPTLTPTPTPVPAPVPVPVLASGSRYSLSSNAIIFPHEWAWVFVSKLLANPPYLDFVLEVAQKLIGGSIGIICLRILSGCSQVTIARRIH